jgi:uncharacterized protein (DUF169 family)
MFIQKVKEFKKVLGIKEEIIGISFVKKPPSGTKQCRDTACTALARALLKGERVVFGSQLFPQLCRGANYFLRLADVSDREARDVYIKDEHVFANSQSCDSFLCGLPKFPKNLINRFIIIKPLTGKGSVDIVIMLLNPPQIGRVLGLLNHRRYQPVAISPNQPSCLAIFAPLATGQPHCNFIDYYDRYYQGTVKGRKIWPEDKMLISLTMQDFQEALNSLEKSPHGSFRPKLKPQKVDPI